MRLLIGFVSVAAAVFCLIGYREWKVTRKPAAPSIDSPSAIDLGEQELGNVAVGHLSIRNNGMLPLVIDNVSTNCSCTGLEEIKEGTYVRVDRLVVYPGDDVPLVIRVSVRGFPVGSTGITSVFFDTNDPNAPKFEVKVYVSKVKGGIHAIPDSIVFGNIPAGIEQRKIIQIFDDAIEPRAIESISITGSSHVRAELQPPFTEVSAPVKATRKHIADIAVVAKSDSPNDLESMLHLRLKGVDRHPDSIRVIGRVQPEIDVFPSNIRLPLRSTEGDVYEVVCICRSPSNRSFDLKSEVSSLDIRVEHEDATDGRSKHRIRVSVKPDAETRIDGNLVLRAIFDDGRTNSVVIPVTRTKR